MTATNVESMYIIDVGSINDILFKCRNYGIPIDRSDEEILVRVVSSGKSHNTIVTYKTDDHAKRGEDCIECLKIIFKAFIDYDGKIKKDVKSLINYLAVAASPRTGARNLSAGRREFEKIYEHYQEPQRIDEKGNNLSIIENFANDANVYIEQIIGFLRENPSEARLEMVEYLKTVKARLGNLSETDGAYLPYIGNYLWQIKREVDSMNKDKNEWQFAINKSYMSVKRQIIDKALTSAEETAGKKFKEASESEEKNKFDLKAYKKYKENKNNKEEQDMPDGEIFKNNIIETAKALRLNIDIVEVLEREEEKIAEPSREDLDNLQKIKVNLEEAIGAILSLQSIGNDYTVPTYETIKAIVKTSQSIEGKLANKELIPIVGKLLKELNSQVKQLGEEATRPLDEKQVKRDRRLIEDYVVKVEESDYYKATVGFQEKRAEYNAKMRNIKRALDEIKDSLHDPEAARLRKELAALISEQNKIADAYNQGDISEDEANDQLEILDDDIEMKEEALKVREEIEAVQGDAFSILRKTCNGAINKIDAIARGLNKDAFYVIADTAISEALDGIRHLLVTRNPNQKQIDDIKKAIDLLIQKMENQIQGYDNIQQIRGRQVQQGQNKPREKESRVKKILEQRAARQASGGSTGNKPLVGSDRRRQEVNPDDTGI